MATTKEPSDAQARRAAYTAATARVREAHRDEFNRYQQEELATRGIEWSPRLTDEEKALASMQETLRKYPNLASQVLVPDVITTA